MTTQPQPHIAVADYLLLDRSSDQRYEYYDGRIIALAGGSEAHSLITVNIASSLHAQLRRTRCAVHSSDMRVAIISGNAYIYPDISIVCGEAQFADEHRDTLINPTIVIEVLSPSTQKRDRGYKSQQYRALPSLQEYIIVEQHACYIEQYVRKTDFQWLLTIANQIDHRIELSSIGCSLLLADIYERVIFPDQSLDEP